MENLIGWLLIVLVPVVIIYTAIKLRRRLEKIKQERYEAEQRLAEERAKQARERERQRIKEREEWQARLDGAGVSAKTSYDFNSDTVRHAVKNKKTNTTTYVDVPAPSNLAPVNNWSNDMLTTMIISDLITNHKDVSAGTVSWKDDTPTYKETYSKPSTDFGMDDSDSRKSSSSSFSSSDSSSSWSSSSSSSSSSDSGPSSDW
jgi:hypothetical protein